MYYGYNDFSIEKSVCSVQNQFISYLKMFTIFNVNILFIVYTVMRQCSSSYRMSGLDRRTNVDIQILSAASKAIAEKCFWNACKALSFGLFLMAVGAIMAIIGMYIFFNNKNKIFIKNLNYLFNYCNK